MPLVTSEPAELWAHCAQQVTAGQLSYDDGGRPYGDERCEGHAQQRVQGLRELTQFTYLDGGADPSDPVARMVERGIERFLWANPEDAACPYCQSPRELSDQQRPVYASLGGARGGPDQLFADRKARRVQTEAAAAAASAQERSAAALERLAARDAGDVDELRTQIAELSDLVAQLSNGHEQRPSDTGPRRRRTPA